MARMRDRLDAPVLVGVGAAFDFHAGLVPQAPDADPARSAWSGRSGSPGAAPAVAALPALQPALRGRASPASTCAHRLAAAPRLASERPWSYDVSVIGLGRVGLPLALSFADAGLSRARRRQRPRACSPPCASGRMPFKEPGTDELLARVDLDLSHRAADGAQARSIVLTLGTPSFSHIEIDMGDIRSVLDDLLPLLQAGPARSSCARPSRPARPSSSPATSRSTAASRSARTSSSPTCPSGSRPTASWTRSGRCRASSAASARPPASARPSCSRRSAPRSCRPRRSQAELAKIWTNILRYATFALPNLLMMDCERYDANVFEVIDLINRDYPRGGIGLPGPHRGDLPAQGLHVLRGASNAPGMLLAVSRVHESVPLFLVDGVKRRLGGALRERKVAVLGPGLQARHRRRARLALAQADPAARARAGRRRGARPGRGDADAGRSRRRSATPTSSSWPPTTARSPARRRCGRSPSAPAPTAWSSTPGTRSARARSSPTSSEVVALRA